LQRISYDIIAAFILLLQGTLMKLKHFGFLALTGLMGVAIAQTTNTAAATTATTTAATSAFSSAQQVAIEKMVHDYLIAHPEVLLEAGQALQMKQQMLMQEKANKVIPTLAASLLHDPSSPVIGNKAGKISVIEFFDYQCPHCKVMGPVMTDLVTQDKDLRVIYKELPIFGPDSEFAAKAALASQKQAKFEAFNKALLAAQERLTNQTVLDIAKSVGLNVNQLQADMNLPEISKELQEVRSLAEKIGISGTPGFIVMSLDKAGKVKSQFIPGQTTLDDIKTAINAVK
jgi:protein-disulfide isomerase